MQRLSGLTLLAGFIAVSSLAVLAQGQPAPSHARDGGTLERVVGPAILPIPNAPFSATIVAEWTHLLPDGTVGTVKNHRLVARDSAGHVFEEHRNFAPDGDQRTTRLGWTSYDDPQGHEYYACVPSSHICEVAPLPMLPPPQATTSALQPGAGSQNSPQTSQVVVGSRTQNGTAAGSGPNVQTENLGQQQIEELDAVGSREIITIAQGQFGNEKAESVIKEFWYSPRLQINLVTKRFDPRVSSSQIFTVIQVNLSEPDPRLFVVPDYQVIRVPSANAAAISASVMMPPRGPQGQAASAETAPR